MRAFLRYAVVGGSLVLSLAHAVAGQATKGGGEPRAISASERAAVAMVADYLDRGVSAWWDYLAESAPLRGLGQEAALREIAVRVGPAEGTIWQLQTPGLRYDDQVAIFSVSFPSGLEETLLFELVEQDGWRLHKLRALVDPAKAAADSIIASASRSGTLAIGVADPLTVPGPLFILGGVLLVWLVRCPRHLRRVVVLGGVSALVWWSCGAKTVQDEPTDSSAQVFEDEVLELGGLLDLRIELATLAQPSEEALASAENFSGLAREAAYLWLAQEQLHRSDLAAASATLAEVSDPSPQPLASLLRARLAFLHVDQIKMSLRYDSAVRLGPVHDGLQLEIGDAHTLLGLSDQAEIIFKLLARMGSRLGEVHYWLATIAVINNRIDEGEALVRTGWSLRPIPRSVLFSNPLLATLAARPSLLGIFDLDQPSEPAVAPRGKGGPGVVPLILPAKSSAMLMGDYLTLNFGTNRILVPGGGALAPTGTSSLDAATANHQLEESALARLDAIVAAVQSGGISGLLRRETETCAAALARREQWDALEELTRGIGANVDRVRPILVKLRARALQELGNTDASRDLLVSLARSDIANSRRDPATLLQLADTMAEAGKYDLAIKLVKKAQRISPQRVSSRRLRLYEMEKRLADDPKRLSTTHFDLVYPRATGERYPKQVGLVLEAERDRLGHWIPIPRTHRIEVQLFPVEAFLRAYASSVAVVGIFDGRVRVPLADLRSLHPQLVSILSHEVAHAMIAGATHDNAPRWLHEGLAQHVEMVATSINPYPDLKATGRILSLPVIDAILAGFGEAQFVDLAYSEAAWLVHGIEARYGVAGIHRLLDAFKRGPDTDEAVQHAFGKSLAAFETDLVDWAVRQAPADWPSKVRRYDHELEENLIRRSIPSKRGSLPKLGTVRKQDSPEQKALRRQHAITEWHQHYSRVTAPTKSALGPVVSAFRGERQTGGFDTATCGRLRDAASQALADPGALSSPDRALSAALEKAYASLHSMAGACLQGQDALVRSELATAEKSLGRAAKILQPLGLRP